MINFDYLKQVYAEQADQLIDLINATPVYFFYNQQGVLPDLSGDLSSKPPSIDAYGGRVPPSDLPSRIEASGTNISNTPNVELITCRVYFQDQSKADNYASKNLTMPTNRVKIIAYNSDINKLKSAIYCTIFGQKFRNTTEPTPYGFGKRYCFSYWEAIGD